MESAAASILQRAVTLDQKKRLTEALVCYQEGMQILMTIMKGIDGEKREKLRVKMESYMTRAETIKKTIETQKEQGVFHEQISIEENSTGHSYETLIGRFLDDDVHEVQVEDPYIRSHHQCLNYLRLCELFVKKCKSLKKVNLLTSLDKNAYEQESKLNAIKLSLRNYGIEMSFEFSSSLHDRQILLNTGWIIKIGRGLDFFKFVDKFVIGAHDYDLRPCTATAVDIFHSKDVSFKKQ